MLSARAAFAQAPSAGAAPMQLGTGSATQLSSEIGIGVGQVVVGTLTTALTGIGAVALAVKADVAPIALIGVIAAPGAGGWIVCEIGRASDQYGGGCGPTIAGAYVGALLFAIPGGYLGAATVAPSSSDGSNDRAIGALFGVMLGVVVGAGVGATIAWHGTKIPRRFSLPVSFGPPPPPPAMLADWSDLRPRLTAARAPLAVGVPVLSLRF
jgi:hypothetical protein